MSETVVPHADAAAAVEHMAAIVTASPPQGQARDIINQIFAALKAQAGTINWLKVMQGLAVITAGGFTPAALLQGLAIIFGNNIPPQLRAHAAAQAAA
jgi:hypothetical protein